MRCSTSRSTSTRWGPTPRSTCSARSELFETGLLLAGDVDPADLRRQLSRWTRSGRIHQLRRGLYVLAPPWRKQHPHPFLVANRLAPGSYVSGLSALAHAGAIPEHVPETTSVTAGRRAASLDSPRPVLLPPHEGRPDVRLPAHRPRTPPVRLRGGAGKGGPRHGPPSPRGDGKAYLEELRLDFDSLHLERLEALAAIAATPKLARAARVLREIAGNTPEHEAA